MPSTILWLAFGIACGGTAADPATNGPSAPGSLRIISDVPRSDTVLARAATPLRIQILGSDRRPARGVTIRFTGTVGVIATPATAVSDADGMASTSLQLGQIAGLASLAVAADSLRINETLDFAVLPGSAAKLVVAWRDTSLMLGDTSRSPLRTTDAYGNTRFGSSIIEVAHGAGVASASHDGSTLSIIGRATGRFVARVKDGAFRDSIAVTVFPTGDVASLTSGSGGSFLMLSRLDGTFARKAAAISIGNVASNCARWTSGGDRVVYSAGSSGLRFASSQGTEGVLLPSVKADGRIGAPAYPVPSTDGQWVYFTWHGGYPDYYDDRSIWRARWDGSSLQEIVPPVGGVSTIYDSFSISGDGTRLVMGTSPYAQPNGMHLWDIRTSARFDYQTAGGFPTWGPGDTLIAYTAGATATAGGLRVMRPDGSGKRALGQPGVPYIGFSWSPDGRWILGVSTDAATHTEMRYWLVDVSTSEVLPLAGLRYQYDWSCRSWRPR